LQAAESLWRTVNQHENTSQRLNEPGAWFVQLDTPRKKKRNQLDSSATAAQ
jgi:hypothetical protein